MRVRVIRGAGTHPRLEDVVDPLLTSKAVCVERGRNVLLAEGPDKVELTLDLAPRPETLALLVDGPHGPTGQRMEVHDAPLGRVTRGKVTGWELSYARDEQGAPVLGCRVRLEHQLTEDS